MATDNLNYPINPEKRDPFYSKSKADVGLPKTPNMSFSEISNAILANVNNQVNEGTIYHLDKTIGQYGASREFPILKMKPNSSYVNIVFGLGVWTKRSEYIGKDVARIELTLSGNGAINYNLNISNNNPNDFGSVKDIKRNANGLNEGTINYTKVGWTQITGRGQYPDQSSTNEQDGSYIDTTTYMSKSYIRLRRFKTGGWLVSLVSKHPDVNAVWINMLWSRNIDPVNVVDDNPDVTWDASLFDKEVIVNCDRSRISGTLAIEGGLEATASYARSLNHDVPLMLQPNDQDDLYNSEAVSHTFTNVGIGKEAEIWNKENSIDQLILKTNEVDCKSPQKIPLSINRLNHQINFRLYGDSLHPSLVSTWNNALSAQKNKKVFIDTDLYVENHYPISISKLSHDIDVSAGTGNYEGSVPEELGSKASSGTYGSGYNSYTLSADKKINYATISSSTTGRESHYEYDDNTNQWVIKSTAVSVNSNAKSLDTNTGALNNLDLVIHGLDHDIKVEVVNSDFRSRRNNGNGAATDDNIEMLSKSSGIKDTSSSVGPGIHNITMNSQYTGTTWNSCVTGYLKLNTFNKSTYQALDLTVHGLDHKITYRSYRDDVDPSHISAPTTITDTDDTNKYRKKSGGQDIIGDIEIDTFSGTIQYFKQRVIDSRYTDCARGLALTDSSGTDYLDHEKVSNDGKHGISSVEYNNAPTINGVPFTGDFRHSISIDNSYTPNPDYKVDSSANSTGRHIEIAAYHRGSSLSTAGAHEWEVLSTLKASLQNSSGVVSSDTNSSYVSEDYGVVKKSSFDGNPSTDPKSFSSWTMGEDDDVVTVRMLRKVMNALSDSNGDGLIKNAASSAAFPIGAYALWPKNDPVPSGWSEVKMSSDCYLVLGNTVNTTPTGYDYISKPLALTSSYIPSHNHSVSITSSASGSHSHGVTDKGHYHKMACVNIKTGRATKTDDAGNSGPGMPYGVSGNHKVLPTILGPSRKIGKDNRPEGWDPNIDTSLDTSTTPGVDPGDPIGLSSIQVDGGGTYNIISSTSDISIDESSSNISISNTVSESNYGTSSDRISKIQPPMYVKYKLIMRVS